MVLVAVTPTAVRLLWLLTVRLGDTTNNAAEFQGLVQGLSQCRRQEIHRLTVVGVSKLILHFLQCGRRPKKPELLAHYKVALHMRAAPEDCAWVHHRRIHNRMTDAAANWALDNNKTRAFHSVADTSATIRQHLNNDVSCSN
ncbi:TPA: hypothetical protein N0F65_008713 [Lagenidium giganteum]|uniref:RNase H type-1 domain-containing protein n=1 Tax=Lagenidium giganteum TaxID=4803 RepID=A0AAV2YU51_9STRA|nr:TPA: hypothetical protein N0F65_008713 [Lagenidium giganteum]